jgi:uncharacterized repeat protein (TIGR03943 family)
MTAVIQRWISATVLVTWGAVLTYFCFTGRVASYLHPAFHPWTLASGIVMLLMAAGVLFLPRREEESPHDPAHGWKVLGEDDHSCCGHDHSPHAQGEACCGHDHHHEHAAGCCGHDHDDRKLRIVPALILIVPLLVAATVSPSQFGATVVANRGFVQNIQDLPGYQPYFEPALPTEDGSAGPTETKPSSSYLPRNEAGQITAQTVDLLYAAEEPAMREDFDGKEVEMIGQYMPAKENNPKGNRFNLVRMFVMCCAADARPVAVSVETDQMPQTSEMSWVKVVGKATFPLEGGRRIPVVVAQSITPCEPPPESFIY